MITDHNIAWIRKRIYLDWADMCAFTTAEINEAGANSFATGELLQTIAFAPGGVGSLADPATFISPITSGNGQGMTLISCTINNVFPLDLLFGVIPVPYDLNPLFPIGFRVNYTASAATNHTPYIYYNFKKVGTTVNNDISLQDVKQYLLFNSVDISSGGIPNLWSNRLETLKPIQFINRSDIESRAVMSFTLGDNSGSLFNLFFGIEMDYVPMRCAGQGRDVDCPVTTMRGY